jgi:hypothetical protein
VLVLAVQTFFWRDGTTTLPRHPINLRSARKAFHFGL